MVGTGLLLATAGKAFTHPKQRLEPDVLVKDILLVYLRPWAQSATQSQPSFSRGSAPSAGWLQQHGGPVLLDMQSTRLCAAGQSRQLVCRCATFNTPVYTA